MIAGFVIVRSGGQSVSVEACGDNCDVVRPTSAIRQRDQLAARAFEIGAIADTARDVILLDLPRQSIAAHDEDVTAPQPLIGEIDFDVRLGA